MSPLKSLTDEHQAIAELLGALHAYATSLRAGESVDPLDLARFAEVLRELVDYRHHEKEEGLLLPLLARNGFEWSEGLLAKLRQEHGHLRHMIDVLEQAAAKDAVLDESGAGLTVARRAPSLEDRRQVADAALALVELKRRHVLEEETRLFPAVQQRLSAAALARLGAELTQFDEALARQAGSSHAWQAAAALVRRYSGGSAAPGVNRDEAAAPSPDPRSLRRVS